MSDPTSSEKSSQDDVSRLEAAPTPATPEKRQFWRTTFFAALVLGLCNFSAPGLWGAMNSLGAGGLLTPYLVNASNALTFSLMVFTATLTPVLCRFVGVRWTLALGAAGYAPYAAGLYCNLMFNTRWGVLFGAALCGLSAGTFWAIEAAVALSYPEPENQGKFLGIWLSFRVAGQILGGAINLGVNSKDDQRGAINPKVYLAFIAIQAVGPFVAFLLPPPSKVQRTDGVKPQLLSDTPFLQELRAIWRIFSSKPFLLIVPLIAQSVWSESWSNLNVALHFSVRSRALSSFLGAVCCVIAGNMLGWFLDRKSLSISIRARWAFLGIQVPLGAWWAWTQWLQSRYAGGVLLDWSDSEFGRGFAPQILIPISFQLAYLYLYFLCGCIVTEPKDIVRIAGLLRAVESAAQAVSYGVNSIDSFGTIGPCAINFGLWGISLVPAWLVVRKVGTAYIGRGVDGAHEVERYQAGEERSPASRNDEFEKEEKGAR